MSKQPILHSFASTEDLKASLSKYILSAQNTALAKHHVFRVAVSGGSLPAMLSDLLKNPEIKWDNWEIFFADERIVPLDHEDSNYGLLKNVLLDKIEGTKPVVHTINPDLEPSECAEDYQDILIKSFAAGDSVKFPVFDLILLGMGPDGHTCSLFPGHELLREEYAWVASIEDSPKPPPKRITLTLPVVNHASKIAFVGTGASKNEVLKKVFGSGGEVLPVGLVNMGAGDRVTWFCDVAATEGVPGFPQRKGSKA
jgi:6-phosphogluconolactonase